jgi:hypothetical protein
VQFLPIYFYMTPMLLLTWTPTAPVRITSARIYRTAADKWMVLIRDIAYDGAPRAKYVSQRDFEMLGDAEAFALSQTGKPARVSL